MSAKDRPGPSVPLIRGYPGSIPVGAPLRRSCIRRSRCPGAPTPPRLAALPSTISVCAMGFASSGGYPTLVTRGLLPPPSRRKAGIHGAMGTGLRRCGKALGVIRQNCSTKGRGNCPPCRPIRFSSRRPPTRVIATAKLSYSHGTLQAGRCAWNSGAGIRKELRTGDGFLQKPPGLRARAAVEGTHAARFGSAAVNSEASSRC
jgi:hypothetical protein